MNTILDVPITSVTSLTAERAVVVIRSILRSECAYARISPSALTISSRLTTADGGIDAEINASPNSTVPSDCIFQAGLTGFQIKSGTSFKPWTKSSIKGELLDSKGQLYTEVERLVRRRGFYTIICTGHDLTPEQRNTARSEIASVLAEVGYPDYEGLLEVLGASQLSEFAERYPGTASLLATDPIQEALVLEEWQHDAHMANVFEISTEQNELISQIRKGLQGEVKHFRVLGEPGLGKTRIVLEAVKDENIAPYVLYVQHGALFGQTKLFRQLIRSGYSRPLVLVIDELQEPEMSDIWRHLKSRCGQMKLVTLDHGRDETFDEEIERLNVPRLSDDTIRKILANRVGDSNELDRWVQICEGSPRVAQAVADNLRANPQDLLKPPSTVPIWTRFLHGYSGKNEVTTRQIDCVTQHLALFSRFGYEDPVGSEAVYIAEQIRKADPTIGWARFQEIIQTLRARRVLQGSRTLFFVPKALHIYLWRQFWEQYGRGFDFIETFSSMPETLHAWFMNMFKFAGHAATTHITNEILRVDGVFSQRAALTSEKGSRFMSILAEANPGAVLRLLETTVNTWTDQDLLDFKDNRQNLVWALEKIAVWPTYTVRAIQVLTKFAVNENADFSNNATGTLVGLFRIGPEAAATEASPEVRLPAMLQLLRARGMAERKLALKAMQAALDTRSRGFRIVGPEYQGLKERANLWIPGTYGDWWQAQYLYFQALVEETQNWPPEFRTDLNLALLDAVEQQIHIPPCTELAFIVLDRLIDDTTMEPGKLNSFFWHYREYGVKNKDPDISTRLHRAERRYTKRDLASRFRRYVIDVEWLEWDNDFRQRRGRNKSRAKALVDALVCRIARTPDGLSHLLDQLAPTKGTPALWYFGDKLAQSDPGHVFFPVLTQRTLETKHQVCLHGYMSGLRELDPSFYFSKLRAFLNAEDSAWLGATIALHSDYDDELFARCLSALEMSWIDPNVFGALRVGRRIEEIPSARVAKLLSLLSEKNTSESLVQLVELLDLIPFDDATPFNPDFVFGATSRSIAIDSEGATCTYHWKNVCLKLIAWDPSYIPLLLDALLVAMGKNYRLSYASNVVEIANKLVQANPSGTWKIVKTHFERTLPKWRSDLFSWLKGGLGGFSDTQPRGAIVDLPVAEIFQWIEEDPSSRAALIAHAAPATLDDEGGGQLTRGLLSRYGHLDGVQNGIGATFHSGGWTGPTSAYLRRKREKMREWLAAGFEFEVVQWIESEIEYLDRSIEREEIDEERSRFD